MVILSLPTKMSSNTVFITRKAHFNAAHRLFRADWSEEQNDSMFGKCANQNWHGHNFDLYVTVKGTPNPDTGFLFDFKKLKQIMETEVVEKLDHKNLNMDVDFLQGKMPSVEILVMEIWKLLEPKLDGCQLHCVKLYETPNNYAEYFG